MTARVRPIPEGYHAVTPYLCVKGAASAIEFYKQAFGAREVMRIKAPGEKIGHAEIAISDSRIMLADEYPKMNFRSPRSIGGSIEEPVCGTITSAPESGHCSEPPQNREYGAQREGLPGGSA